MLTLLLVMDALIKIAKNTIKLDINEILREIYRLPEVQEFILNLNKIDQLYDKGIDSTGASLGEYSANTIEGTNNFEGKRSKGQPTDRITLKDKGIFYDSFLFVIGADYFSIEADPIRGDTNLFDDFGEDILGLTEESLQKLREYLLPLIQKYALNQICHR